MARNIFIVNATIVDANGSYAVLSGYPKTFDSKIYSDDIEGTLNRAKSDYHNVLGTMYGNQANRQIQTATLMTVRGDMILREAIGNFPVEPEPEPNPEAEE